MILILTCKSRLAYSASVPALQKAKDMSIYMRPPVSDFGTLEFGSFQAIYDIGYNYAKAFLADARERGELDNLTRISKHKPHDDSGRKPKDIKKSLHPSGRLSNDRRNSL